MSIPSGREPHRLFVALYPSSAWVRAAAAALESLEIPPLRATRTDQVHMTALFVGNVHPKQLERVSESVRGAAAGTPPFTVAFDALRALPERGPRRLVAATASETPDALADLHRRLVQRCTPGRRAKGAFLAHVTLGRFRSPTAVSGPLGERTGLPVELEPVAFDALDLVESRLGPDGALHRRLANHPLRGR